MASLQIVIDIMQQTFMVIPMKCATYLRVSTSDQSVEAQRMELASFAAQKGWAIEKEFVDTASGARRERPGLEALMAAVMKQEVEAVLCVKLDRMARSLGHFSDLVDDFEAAEVALICTSQGIDTSKSNACGKLQMAVLSAVAAFERELIRERTRAGLAVARAAGKQLGRVSKLMPTDPEERASIVEAWREAGGTDYRRLGEALGGVSGSTAWRVARKLPGIASVVPAGK